MGRLKQILELSLEESRSWASMGRANTDLLGALTDYRQQLLLTLVILTTWIVFLVAVSTYLIALHQDEVASLRLVSAALGIAAGAGIEICRRIGSEWSRTQLLSLLVAEAPEAMVPTLVQRLIDKL